MKALFVAAEAVPFVKTGGLGDVIGSLPKALQSSAVDICIVLPKYKSISQQYKSAMVAIKSISISMGGRERDFVVEQLNYRGSNYFFIGNDELFGRNDIYGYPDDAERYGFFCRAVLETLPHLDFKPDIIHCHDWHTGMISVFLDSHYKDSAFYRDMATIFTIHNLRYQGVFPKDTLALLDLNEQYFTIDGIEFYNQINFMKGGLNFSDIITTVSDTYAKEILTPYFGENLEGLLNRRRGDLYGIVNGIDYVEYNPVKDNLIYTKYHKNALVKRSDNKLKLQAELNLPVTRDLPLVAIVSRLVAQKGMDLVAHVMEEILSLDLQLVILGTGDKRYADMFTKAAARYPEKVSANILFDNTLAHKIYAGADMLLMPSLFEPCGLSQLIALRYGCIPIVREVGGLKDTITAYNEITQQGNGFSFTNYNAHDMLHTIQRALKYQQRPAIWKRIIKNAMNCDYSWQRSADKYKRLYEMLLTRKEQDSLQ
ncbi:glycogen synthase GlgA [Peptococcaceae bacterium 1198_IL3148]